MKRHRNSQKRIYIPEAVYSITTNTYNSFPFFENDLLCELFVKDLQFTKQLKSFDVFGYKINPEHIHLLIQPTGEANYSQIMRSLKTNFARNANYILGYNDLLISDECKARSRDRALHVHTNSLLAFHDIFMKKHGPNHRFPKFVWQKSYHDHIIRDKSDYFAHLKYIQKQWVKHELSENKFCFTTQKLPDLSYTENLMFAT